jgi:hypothetical protein
MDYTGREFHRVLYLAHKYCMETLEKDIMLILEDRKTTDGYVDLIVASQIIDSRPTYERALRQLCRSIPMPTLEQAKLIGVEAIHTVMMFRASCNQVRCRGNEILKCASCNNNIL